MYEPIGTEELALKIFWRMTAAVISCMLTISSVYAESLPIQTIGNETPSPAKAESSYYIEISISRNILSLSEYRSTGELIPVTKYTVGTAARGLKTYPLGHGTVTGIFFNPWWYPTPYSRQVFKKRGIELPKAVQPGTPLNYMGPFKIALSHRTSKGAVYRIHGNNNPQRVGRRVTGGCFVMDNTEGLELAHKIKVGTEVNIVP